MKAIVRKTSRNSILIISAISMLLTGCSIPGQDDTASARSVIDVQPSETVKPATPKKKPAGVNVRLRGNDDEAEKPGEPEAPERMDAGMTGTPGSVQGPRSDDEETEIYSDEGVGTSGVKEGEDAKAAFRNMFPESGFSCEYEDAGVKMRMESSGNDFGTEIKGTYQGSPVLLSMYLIGDTMYQHAVFTAEGKTTDSYVKTKNDESIKQNTDTMNFNEDDVISVEYVDAATAAIPGKDAGYRFLAVKQDDGYGGTATLYYAIDKNTGKVDVARIRTQSGAYAIATFGQVNEVTLPDDFKTANIQEVTGDAFMMTFLGAMFAAASGS